MAVLEIPGNRIIQSEKLSNSSLEKLVISPSQGGYFKVVNYKTFGDINIEKKGIDDDTLSVLKTHCYHIVPPTLLFFVQATISTVAIILGRFEMWC